jgi:hypothetical protein
VLAGPTHLRALAAHLVRARSGEPLAASASTYSWPRAFTRTLLLYPSILSRALVVIGDG